MFDSQTASVYIMICKVFSLFCSVSHVWSKAFFIGMG